MEELSSLLLGEASVEDQLVSGDQGRLDSYLEGRLALTQPAAVSGLRHGNSRALAPGPDVLQLLRGLDERDIEVSCFNFLFLVLSLQRLTEKYFFASC